MGRLVLRIAVVCFLLTAGASAQVFVVGEKTATDSIKTDFTATHIELPTTPINERGRRTLLRDLEAEQGFAHRVLPIASIITLEANGNMTPGPEAYKKLIYKKGQAAEPGDRVAITALNVKSNSIDIDFNGGPYVKHRFLRHIQVGVGTGAGGVQTPSNLDEQATGCRVTLLFEGPVPDLSGAEVKALLQPIVDFGAKTGEQAYAETLPAPVKRAIDMHDVMVGMNHRMVLAAVGQPENKVRETADGQRYEEWIYGHQPQTIKFVRFVGDRVTLVKIAVLGRQIEVHDHAEIAELAGDEPAPTRTVLLGDVKADPASSAPPRLLKDGEKPDIETDTTQRRVQYPDGKPKPADAPVPTAPQ